MRARRTESDFGGRVAGRIPARLSRLREPFDHAEWLFEIKHDGFRGLAYIENGAARLVSRNGNTFKSFAGLCAWLGPNVPVRDAILDGEIVCLAPDGRALFDVLLYRRAEPYYQDLSFNSVQCLRRIGPQEPRHAKFSRELSHPASRICLHNETRLSAVRHPTR